MKLLALLHESMNLSLYIEDIESRVNNSIEYNWIRGLSQNTQSYLSPNTQLMKEYLKKLIQAQKGAKIAIDNFYELFPYLRLKFSYTDKKVIYDEKNTYSQIEINLSHNKYLLQYQLSNEIFCGLSSLNFAQERVDRAEQWMQNELADYHFTCYENNNILFIQSNYYPLEERYSYFTQDLEYLADIDFQILGNFYEKNPAISDYMDKRKIIPEIISQCHHDSLFEQPTDQATCVFEQIVSNYNRASNT